MSATNTLTPDQIESAKAGYQRDGFIVLRNMIDPARLTALHRDLAQEFERAAHSGELFSGGGLVSGHLNCFPGAGARFIYDTLVERGVIDLIRQLHPAAERLPNIGCNFNLPGSHTQHFHTDRPFSREFIIANVSLVDTDIANGATDIIPGTHTRMYKYTEFALKRMSKRGQRVITQQGDVVIRSSNAWHRGMTNHTHVPRPMVALTWEDGGSELADPFTAYDGKIRFLPNWFKPTRLGRLREQLFVRVPFTYAALRFARSLVDNEY